MISLGAALKSLLRSVLRVESTMTISSRKATAPRLAAPYLGMTLLLLTGLSFPAFSQSPTIHATIDASKTGAPISKYIYGQFLEHGGDIVNTGVWSEMLVDRKFFYPVAASAPTPPPLMSNAGGNADIEYSGKEVRKAVR
jgi:alpha-N-arabinofuranosidase